MDCCFLFLTQVLVIRLWSVHSLYYSHFIVTVLWASEAFLGDDIEKKKIFWKIHKLWRAFLSVDCWDHKDILFCSAVFCFQISSWIVIQNHELMTSHSHDFLLTPNPNFVENWGTRQTMNASDCGFA